MTLRDRTREMTQWLTDAIFVPMCSECNRRGSWVCDECRGKVRHLRKPGCARCGVANQSDCECASLPDSVVLLRSVFPYAGWVRSSIHRFKYEGEFARAESLADELDCLRLELGAMDLVIPVPVHRRRLRERGFNQSALMGARLATLWGIPCVEALSRPVDNGRQVGRARMERWQSVADVFSCPRPSVVRGKRVAVLDDVITTGATVSACAVALETAGAVSVVGMSLARG